MSKSDPKTIGSQLRNPNGTKGLQVAEEMNKSNEEMYNLLFEVLSPSSSLLEIGFGNGAHFTRYFSQGYIDKLTGLDYSKTMCNEAKERNKRLIDDKCLQIVCGDVLEMPFRDHRFDVIVALNTIYFWDPIEAYLSRIKQVLKPNGKIYFGYRPKCRIKDFAFVKKGFILYDQEELNSLLNKNDLSIQEEITKTYEKRNMSGRLFLTTDIITVCQHI